MEKRLEKLEDQITAVARKFLRLCETGKEIQVISHFDTDGITSATIIIQTLRKLDKNFSLKIVKVMDEEVINNLSKEKITLFLDLASNSLAQIKNAGLQDVFIVDHHEVTQEIPENITILNTQLHEKQKMSASCLVYLFCKELVPESKELAKLGVLGMIGDMLGDEIDKLDNRILEDGEIKRKRGLLIYPSTRPLNRVLEYCSDPYIPEVTGNTEGVLDLLREIGLKPINGRYKSLLELDEEEMSKLVTAIMLKNPKTRNKQIIGDIFLIKLYNKLEDARELSAKVNACSRLGESGLAIQLLMENTKAKKKAESIYIKYKQHIISGLKFVNEINKTQGKGYVIINAGNQIKDTIVGVIASILSSSALYEDGTIITTMALEEQGEKIKVSSRIAGRTGRNVREVLSQVIDEIGGEVGGHAMAAGCVIDKSKEKEFITLLEKKLEIEVIKI